MLDLAFSASAEDDVILKAHVRCRSCLGETYPLVPVNRPPGGVSALAIFLRRRMFERMAFRCDTCGHAAADLVAIDYASAADVVQPPDPFPHASPPRLRSEFVPAGQPRGFELRNGRTGASLGVVTACSPEEVLDAFLREAGMTVEEFVACFGTSLAEVRAALDIVEVAPAEPAPARRQATRPLTKATPVRRPIYQEVTP